MNPQDTHNSDQGRERPKKAPKDMTKKVVIGSLVAAALAGSATFGALALAHAETVTPQPMPVKAATVLAPPATLAPNTFSVIAEKVSPAVVNIQVEETASAEGEDENAPGMGQGPFRGLPKDSPFQDFFEKFFGENGPNGQWQQLPQPGTPHAAPRQKTMAMGSGFIIDPKGYVVTNDHVAGKADKITVTLNDGTKYDATLVGRDSKTDLALLKVKADKPLPYVAWGDSKHAKVGDWVVAVGNPFGLGGTVTAGIVSARGRDINAGPFDDFLQIDAPINRGNSGGPTFNLQGQVIGINTAIYSPNGGSVGIGFAVPASLAQPIIAQLKEKGSVERGWLGVQIQQVTPEIAESLGLDKKHGALVSKVEPNGPAAKAGLKQGDVIVSVDGETIEKMRELPKVVAAKQAGKKIAFGIWRNGEKKSLGVVVGAMPTETKVASASPETDTQKSAFGMTLAALSSELRTQYRIPDGIEGVLVLNVKTGSPAAKVGLAPGDVIRRVGKENVSAPTDVKHGIDTARGQKRKAVLILVNRRGNELFLAMRLRKA